MRYRAKSTKRAEDEIKRSVIRYGAERVVLTDSVINTGYFKTLFPALVDWGVLEDLFLEVRPDLTKEQLRLLRAAGVTIFQPGIESLDSNLLTLMKKSTTLLQNVQLLKWSRELGLYPTWNLLYGFPGEDEKAYSRMTELIPSLFHLFPPMDLSPVLLVRFSPLFEDRDKWNLRCVHAHPCYREVYPFEQEQLDKLAYFFECQFDGKHRISRYLKPLADQVKIWKKIWQDSPPVLLLEEHPEGSLVLHDSRPGRNQKITVLKGIAAIAYLKRDEAQDIDSLVRYVHAEMGNEYPGDSVLAECLERLVSARFMLREGDRYLSLATRAGLDPRVSQEWL